MRRHISTRRLVFWRCAGKCGFTMIEALVAVTILGFFVVGVCALVVTTRETMDTARAHYTASNIAKNRIERLHALVFDDLAQYAEAGVVVNDSGMPSSSGNFMRTTVVSNVNDRLFDIRCVVTMRNRVSLAFEGGGESVQTLIARYEAPER